MRFAKVVGLALVALLLGACVSAPPALSEDEQWLADHQWIWDNLLYFESVEEDGILYFYGYSMTPSKVDDAI